MHDIVDLLRVIVQCILLFLRGRVGTLEIFLRSTKEQEERN